MTFGELKQFVEENNIPEETPLTMETGIDVIVDVSHVVHNGLDLVLYQEHFGEEGL